MKIFTSHLLLVFLITSLLSACTLPIRKTEPGTPLKTDQTLTQVDTYKHQGQWQSATEVLQEALQKDPDNPLLLQALEKLQQARQHEKTTLYHNLLISETQALLQQVALLNKIKNNSQTDIKAKTALLIKNLLLDGKLEELNECILYQQQHALKLARSCSYLLDRIENSKDSKQQYVKINKAYLQALERNQQRAQRKSNAQLLKQANQLVSEGQYLKAHLLAEEVMKTAPENDQAQQLLLELKSTINEQAEILLNVGDQLYRDGQLEQAIAVWTSLLKILPDNSTVQTKIKRAEHVLSKLQNLRQEQKPQQ